MAKKAPKPDFHHMDLKALRGYQVNLNCESVKKNYKAYRDTWEKSGQRGRMPEGALLVIASQPALVPKPKAALPAKEYKRPHIKRPGKEVKSGSKQSSSNVHAASAGSGDATELAS